MDEKCILDPQRDCIGKAEAVRIPGGKTLDQVMGFPCQIYTGSYVGTGTYGQSNPNELTFPFEPKIIIGITPEDDSSALTRSMIRPGLREEGPMKYVRSTPNLSGAYPGPQSRPFPGCLPLTDSQAATLVQYNGFVTITQEPDEEIEASSVTVTPDPAGWEEVAA